jgi:Flp pilus assembly protein TadD
MRSGTFALLSFLVVSLPVIASADAAKDAAWNDAYQQLLKRPADKATNERYAALSIERKDYESAIPPLERLSMQSPDDMRYVLQLGEMYQKLDSKAVARSYFEQVAKHPKSTPEQKAEANKNIQ